MHNDNYACIILKATRSCFDLHNARTRGSKARAVLLAELTVILCQCFCSVFVFGDMTRVQAAIQVCVCVCVCVRIENYYFFDKIMSTSTIFLYFFNRRVFRAFSPLCYGEFIFLHPRLRKW